MTQAAAQQVSPVREGEVIGGKYRVERILGIGGMGVVVAAKHLQLEQKVALKFLRPEAKDNSEVVERFTREARAAVKIQSEHVGRVIDVGQLESGDLFMVMEYLEGRDLSEILESEGRLSPARAVEYVLQACEAIGEAHANGIIHRDLKPANLFLARRVDGSQIIKVLDFGISKLTLSRLGLPDLATDPSLTNPTAVMGSPLYMSPEQMHSSVRVDARSDIWALGVMLYEMVSGKTPFEEESIPLIHAAILHNPPPPLKDKVPNLPPRFEAILGRCLEKDPTKRYADVAELAVALAPISPRQGRVTTEKLGRLQKAIRISERPPGDVSVPDPNAPASTITAWGEGKRSGRSRSLVAVAFLVLAAGAAAGAFALKRGNPFAALSGAHTPAAAPPPSPLATEVPPAATPTPTETPAVETTAPRAIPSASATSSAGTHVARAPFRPRRPGAPPKPSGEPSAAPAEPPKPPPAPAPSDGTNGFGDRE